MKVKKVGWKGIRSSLIPNEVLEFPSVSSEESSWVDVRFFRKNETQRLQLWKVPLPSYEIKEELGSGSLPDDRDA